MTVRRSIALASGLLMVAAVTACSSMGPTRVESEQVYLRHAGEPVEKVRYRGSIRGWQPIGTDAVMLSFARNQYYLLDLTAGCHLEARNSENLRLKTVISRQISRFDRVQFRSASCRIEQIRPVDYEAARAELDALKMERDSFDRRVEHQVEPAA